MIENLFMVSIKQIISLKLYSGSTKRKDLPETSDNQLYLLFSDNYQILNFITSSYCVEFILIKIKIYLQFRG